MPPARQCFVISPIGAEGSDVRLHCDDVFEFIVKPAMEELGIRAYRADHHAQLGKISEQMFGSILGDDLCVAILTFHNPNVFYELAVAQCAARPVIILIEKGTAIPFDIRDLRVVEYDLKPRPLRDKVYVQKIVAMAKSLEDGSWKAEVPFGEGLLPLGAPKRSASLHEAAGTAPEAMDWTGMLDASREFFELSGVSLYGWSRSPGFVKALAARCQAGCQVRIVLLHPENPSLAQYLVGMGTTSSLDQLRQEIRLASEALLRAAGGSPRLELRLLRSRAPHLQTAANEQAGTAVPYLFSKPKKEGPALVCRAGGLLHKTLREEFALHWREAAPETATGASSA